MKNAIISIDVETDWGGRLSPGHEYLRGVRYGLPSIYEILQTYSIQATLFINGQIVPWIGPELQQAVDLGYEIASHGYTHRRLPELSTAEVVEEVAKSKFVLEQATGQMIRGFRAPQARMPMGLHQILAEQGYLYDSSVFGGTMPTRFSNGCISADPYLQDGIWEVPVNQIPLIPLPMGLLWLDLFTVGVFRFSANMVGWPNLVHLYIHPFDVISAYPVKGIPWGAKLWYTRRKGSALRTLNSLIKLLLRQGYNFITTVEAISN